MVWKPDTKMLLHSPRPSSLHCVLSASDVSRMLKLNPPRSLRAGLLRWQRWTGMDIPGMLVNEEGGGASHPT